MNLPPPLLKFETFQKALQYHLQCPLCNGDMGIDDRNLENSPTTYSIKQRLLIAFQQGLDLIELNTYTDKVKIVKYDSAIWSEPKLSERKYTGTYLHGISIVCESCELYSYTLQLRFNMLEEILESISLNSETAYIMVENYMHMIKTSYFTDRLYYAYENSKGNQSANFPIILLNFQNPIETINRLQKLLIFT